MSDADLLYIYLKGLVLAGNSIDPMIAQGLVSQTGDFKRNEQNKCDGSCVHIEAMLENMYVTPNIFGVEKHQEQ